MYVPMALQDLIRKQRSHRLYRDLVIYLIFLTIFLSNVASWNNFQAHYSVESAIQAAVVDDEFEFTANPFATTYKDIWNNDDWWDWATGPLANSLFTTTWYNDQNMTVPEYGYVTEYNRLLGALRFRQIRTRPNSCVIPHRLAQSTVIGKMDCYENYHPNPYVAETTEYQGTSYSQWYTTYLLPLFGEEYILDGGGYIVDIDTSDPEAAVTKINALKESKWTDWGTTAVVVTFHTYNANLNLFTKSEFVTEVNAGGLWIPSFTIQSIKLDRYTRPIDIYAVVSTVVFILCMFFFFFVQVREIRDFYREEHEILHYLFNFWNLLDTVFNIGTVLLIVIRLAMILNYENYMIVSWSDSSNFLRIPFLMTTGNFENQVTAVLVFLSFIKIFKYLHLNTRMNMLNKTLVFAAPDLATFIVLFAIVFLAFAFAGYALFGANLDIYASPLVAMSTTFQILLGFVTYGDLERVNRFWAPIYFVSYIVLVFFIMVNMFLAILNDSYAKVNEEMKDERDMVQKIADRMQILKRRKRKMGKKGNALSFAAFAPSKVSTAETIRKLENFLNTRGADMKWDELEVCLGADASTEFLERMMLKYGRSLEEAQAEAAEKQHGPEED